MSIFVDESTKVVVQGLTGGQGRFHGLRNRDYGTKVVAGRHARARAATDVDGVPVFDTVAEAVAATGADACFVVVPPKGAAAAILEAAARRHPASSSASPRASRPRTRPSSTTSLRRDLPGTRLLGPNCPGIISPGQVQHRHHRGRHRPARAARWASSAARGPSPTRRSTS